MQSRSHRILLQFSCVCAIPEDCLKCGFHQKSKICRHCDIQPKFCMMRRIFVRCPISDECRPNFCAIADLRGIPKFWVICDARQMPNCWTMRNPRQVPNFWTMSDLRRVPKVWTMSDLRQVLRVWAMPRQVAIFWTMSDIRRMPAELLDDLRFLANS